jgi:hypothetical protein
MTILSGGEEHHAKNRLVVENANADPALINEHMLKFMPDVHPTRTLTGTRDSTEPDCAAGAGADRHVLRL